jgi:hypothetical protein
MGVDLMPGKRPSFTEVPNPAYLAAVKRQKAAEKAAFCYQPKELGPKSNLPPQPSLLMQLKEGA